jgi:chromosome segregation ATPase
MNKIKALKEERGRLLGELSTLQTTIEREARSMADTETNRLSEIEARLGAIKAEVETLQPKPLATLLAVQKKKKSQKWLKSTVSSVPLTWLSLAVVKVLRVSFQPWLLASTSVAV